MEGKRRLNKWARGRRRLPSRLPASIATAWKLVQVPAARCSQIGAAEDLVAGAGTQGTVDFQVDAESQQAHGTIGEHGV